MPGFFFFFLVIPSATLLVLHLLVSLLSLSRQAGRQAGGPLSAICTQASGRNLPRGVKKKNWTSSSEALSPSGGVFGKRAEN